MLRRVLLLVAVSTVLGTSLVTMAQDRGGSRPEAAAPTAGTAAPGDQVQVEAEEREEGAGKVKVFEFGGLDISGRLKSPQLLYFLNRLRAEFDRPKLPHRSFMPELVRSTKGKAF